jgi:hypothetical protein
MKKSILLLTFLITAVSASFAQLDSALTISGSVDAYFRSNLNASNNPLDETSLSPGTSFANLPGFALGMANLVFGYNKDKVGVTADLAFGPRGNEASSLIGAGLNIVNQLNVSYQVSDKVKFTLGKFNTFLGYEVISPVLNMNYSTSNMFSYGPFSHTGLKANFDLGGGFSALAAVMNPTDLTNFNPIGKYVGGAQIGYTGAKSFIFLNTLLNDDFSQFDITANHKFTEKFSVGLNATTMSDAFSGVALYSTVGISDASDVSLRVESFQDNGINKIGNSTILGNNPAVIDATLSLNIRKGNFRLVPEFRVDLLNGDADEYKLKKIGTSTNYKTGDKLSSFILAAIANF